MEIKKRGDGGVFYSQLGSEASWAGKAIGELAGCYSMEG